VGIGKIGSCIAEFTPNEMRENGKKVRDRAVYPEANSEKNKKVVGRRVYPEGALRKS